MKKLFCTFCLIGLMTSWAFAQLPFEPFAAYPGNPVIPRTAGSWDAGVVIGASMVFVNDTFYVCYEGVYRNIRYYPNDPMSIGLATSADGFTFEKSPANPILSGDGSGFDAFSAQAGALYYDSVHWYLYYGGLAAPPTIPTRIISRAIATSPHGPWVRTNDTLLIGGSEGEWDDKCCAPLQILPTDSGLVMYYFGSDDWYPNAFTVQHGMATSTDGGATWQKYNDPTTTTPPYAESDPVLKAGPELDIYGAGVIRHNNLWEMFYSGSSAKWPPSDTANICYATSADGIHWTKYSGNPIFTNLNDPVLSVGVLEIPTVVFDGSKYFLLYDYAPGQAGIGLAIADNVIPVEFISFTVKTNDKGVTLNWTTATELNNQGFEVQRKFGSNSFATIGSVKGHGTTTSPNNYTYIDKLTDAGKYFYRLKQIDYGGKYEYSKVVEVNWSPFTTYKLEQNYPNPFNPTTTIGFGILEKGNVRLIHS